MSNYTTNTEFIARELHTLVSDPALYNWEEIWAFLRDRDVIFYGPATQTFRWNDNSYYRQCPGVLYDLIDSYALDTWVTEKRYVAGELWTRRLKYNAATGYTRGSTYITRDHFVSAVYDTDGTRYATTGRTLDGKPLCDPDASDAAWDNADRAWNLSILNNTNNN